jgi:hypothetical protein
MRITPGGSHPHFRRIFLRASARLGGIRWAPAGQARYIRSCEDPRAGGRDPEHHRGSPTRRDEPRQPKVPTERGLSRPDARRPEPAQGSAPHRRDRARRYVASTPRAYLRKVGDLQTTVHVSVSGPSFWQTVLAGLLGAVIGALGTFFATRSATAERTPYGRPWAAEARPHRKGHRRGARLHPEPPPRPLRPRDWTHRPTPASPTRSPNWPS